MWLRISGSVSYCITEFITDLMGLDVPRPQQRTVSVPEQITGAVHEVKFELLSACGCVCVPCITHVVGT